MRLGVLNEYTQAMQGQWYTLASKIMLPDYLEQYRLFNQYIPVCPWYVLSTYQYVLESPKSF